MVIMAINTDSKYTNIEALTALTSGKPEVWSKFASEHSSVGMINLSGVELKGLNLDGFTIKNVDLDGADLEGVTIKNTVFENTNLVDANLKGSTIKNTNFTRTSRLSGANFKDATLENVDFDNTVATKIIFDKADLKAVKSNGSMTSANFKGATVVDSKFKGVIFGETGMLLDGSKTKSSAGSDFTGSKLRNVDFSKAMFNQKPVFLNATIENVDFSRSSLIEAKFTKATIKNVDFSEASLLETKFTEASISRGSKFNNANLMDTVFSPDKVSPDTDFSGSLFLDKKMEKTINDRKLAEFHKSEKYKPLNPPIVPPTEISDNDNRKIAGKPVVAKVREK